MPGFVADPLDRLLELAAAPPAPPDPPPPEPVGTAPDLARLLPLLRCPETGQPLLLAEGALRTADGSRAWPMVAGRPNLFPGLEAPTIHPAGHPSNPLDQQALRLIRGTEGWVLNLSAGSTAQKFAHVVEVEAGVFRHTD